MSEPRAAPDATGDVAVVGDGPAGLALASACIRHGVTVALIGPDAPWTATYGTWVDELPAGLASADRLFAARAPIDAVGRRRHALGRDYAVVDHGGLRRALADAPSGRTVDRVTARVVGATHHLDGVRLRLDDGSVLQARIAVDASGSLPVLVRRTTDPRRAPVQAAYGVVLDHRPEVVEGDGAVLMDWRPPGERFAIAEPTFLYVVPLGAGRWLVEETSLAQRPAMTGDELRARLAARLGFDPTHRAEHVEHVAIPMAGGLPDRAQPAVAFGAAAGFVHPATGYSVTASLRAADRVAAAITQALHADVVDTAAVWDAVWPRPLRATRRLHDVGLRALLGRSPAELQEFFDAFFDLPAAQWSGYLRIDTPPGEISSTMWRLFRSVPPSMRRRLAAAVVPRPTA